MLKGLFWFAIIALILGVKYGGPSTKIGSSAALVLVILIYISYRAFKNRSYIPKSLYRPWLVNLCDRIHLLWVIFNFPEIFVLPVFTCYTLCMIPGAVIVFTSYGFLPLPFILEVVFYFAVAAVSVFAIFDFDLLRNMKNYRKSAYFQATQIPFKTVFYDKGLWGEYMAFLRFGTVPMYQRFLFNVIIPQSNDPADFAEVDLISISERGIFVVEAKNRGGKIIGNLYSDEWTQEIGSQTNEFENPIKQNQFHIEALYKYTEHIGLKLPYQAYNVVFFADPSCGIDFQGALPSKCMMCWTNTVKSNLMELGELMNRETIDDLADILEEYTLLTPYEREDRMAQRAARMKR